MPRVPNGTKVTVTRDEWNDTDNEDAFPNRLGQIGTVIDSESEVYYGVGVYKLAFPDGTEGWVTDVKPVDERVTIPGSVFRPLDLSFDQAVNLIKALEEAGVTVDLTK